LSEIHIYQIFYDGASKAQLDPGFLALDNCSNERPDWFEYHPIRKFLLDNKLEDNDYYGFLSPKFGSKTNLSATKVKDFIRDNEGVDVAIFCHFLDESAFYHNIFYQGEASHPGLIDISQRFAIAAGLNVDIRKLVTDSTNTIFSNFFVAKPIFWKTWFRIAEQLYHLAESQKEPALGTATRHRGVVGIQQKVFLMERLATLLLSTSDSFKVAVYAPTELPMHFPKDIVGHQAVVLDALKISYRRLKNKQYLDQYFVLCNAVHEHIFGRKYDLTWLF
jgi:hypothetical protein